MSDLLQARCVLALAPHTDDVELGCGGTLVRLAAAGVRIEVAVFSLCHASLPEHLPPDTLAQEFAASMDILGIPNERRHVYDYPVRCFADKRQEILEHLVTLRHALNPDVVLAPAASDVHQDHAVIHREATRAFKHATRLGYELAWNSRHFDARAFVPLGTSDLDRKWEMLACYRSQIDLGRPYFDRSLIEGLARVRGVQAGQTYAEAFEVDSWIVAAP